MWLLHIEVFRPNKTDIVKRRSSENAFLVTLELSNETCYTIRSVAARMCSGEKSVAMKWLRSKLCQIEVEASLCA